MRRLHPVSFLRSAVPAGVFDPATLPLSLWGRAPWAGAWSGLASAGASGGRDFSYTGTVTVGAPLNGRNTADLSGGSATQLYPINGITSPQTWTLGAGSMIVLACADTVPAANANAYLDAGLSADVSTRVGLTISDGGLRGYLYDTSNNWKMTPAGGAPMATGAFHVAQLRWNSTSLDVRTDRGTWASIPAAAIANDGAFSGGGGFPRFGTNYNNSANFDGRMAEVMCSQVCFADAVFDNLLSYFNAFHGLSL